MSALLSANDLNDFISPGLACIKPAGEVRMKDSSNNYEVQIGINGEAMEVSIDDGTISNLPSANISLQDCLACSGCITSAEEVLLSKQTHKVLIDDLNKWSSEKIFVMSLSHQSRISLSDFLNLPVYKIDEFLINFFSERFGFKFIVGTELSRELSIYKINSEVIKFKHQDKTNDKPLLSSICPGFVLYVEKTKPEILPYLLNVKSPQQITGTLLKELISQQMNITKGNIYHLSIMPCFDKKLEAARSDSEVKDEFQDVDCVLTPKELIELLKEENVNIFEYITKSNELPLELYKRATPTHWPNPIESWYTNKGGSSGGYAYNYILALQQYYNDRATVIKEIKGKNSDVVEFQLIDSDGTKLGSSAIVNGFRNIQNLVRKLKPSGKVKIGSGLAARRKARMKNSGAAQDVTAEPSGCDFVEVMACPGGCINGGGINQVSLSQESTDLNDVVETDSSKDHLSRLNKKYEEDFIQLDLFEVGRFEFLKQFVTDFVGTFNVEERLFKYKFNAIEKANDILSVGSTW